jgi:phosphoglucomutase
VTTPVSPFAGQPAQAAHLVDVPHLIDAYYRLTPDPAVLAQRVAFGTSGHRGSSFDTTFNEAHVLAITQAICRYRRHRGTDGPLFIGIDTHALSGPAFRSALEVLAANGVEAMVAPDGEYTPTPAVSHAIVAFNRGRADGMADGIVVTPSHNPPNGGPAPAGITGPIEATANALLEGGLRDVRRLPFEQARRAATTHDHDFLTPYVNDLGGVVDLDAVRRSGIRMGVDPLGGAGVQYWPRIAERYGLDLCVVSEDVDPTFRFMTLDWDGRIRMDPSSPYAMQRLIGLKDRFDVAFACDTDHDRHGIVTPSTGLLPPNHYLVAMVDYLFRQRPAWSADAAVGKTMVSSALIDRAARSLARALYEVPVGFKWYADGLFDGSLAFAGEESAGASFVRIDGAVWTTDKDGIVPALLSAEICARAGRDPGELYGDLARALGEPVADRVDGPATVDQKKRLATLSPQQMPITELGGEVVSRVMDRAPGNDAPMGGIKVVAENGWFAVRPSGTEDLYRIYAESFQGAGHLRSILRQAQEIVDHALNGN